MSGGLVICCRTRNRKITFCSLNAVNILDWLSNTVLFNLLVNQICRRPGFSINQPIRITKTILVGQLQIALLDNWPAHIHIHTTTVDTSHHQNYHYSLPPVHNISDMSIRYGPHKCDMWYAICEYAMGRANTICDTRIHWRRKNWEWQTVCSTYWG